MKVAMICDVMGQPNNGTTLAALNLIRYLRDAGHTVTVVAPGGEASDGYLPVRVWHAGPLIDRTSSCWRRSSGRQTWCIC